MDARAIRSHGVPGPPSAGDGEDRRPAVLLVGGSDDAAAARRRRRRLRSRHRPGRRPPVRSHDGRPARRRRRARRRRDVPPRRHRLRRPRHLGAGRGVSAEQPIDRLPRRSGDAKSRGGVPLRRSPWRRRLQHRRPHPARGELGLALDLPLRPRPIGKPDRRRRTALHAAREEPVALRRLPGLQVRREAANALHGHRRRATGCGASVRCRSAGSTSSIW